MRAGCPIGPPDSLILAKAVTVCLIVGLPWFAANREDPQSWIEKSAMPFRSVTTIVARSTSGDERLAADRPPNEANGLGNQPGVPNSRPEGRRRTLLPGQPFEMMNKISKPRRKKCASGSHPTWMERPMAARRKNKNQPTPVSADPNPSDTPATASGGPSSETVAMPTDAAPDRPKFIVGIGSSAGGLEAVKALLEALPADTGMAFVLIQHLDPHHPSALVEILSKATSMPVEEASDGAAACANHVVIIPPNVDMTIQHGMLRLTPRTTARTLHLPIDMFLRSLAEDLKSRAIGVILSGTGTDGTLGLKAVKGEGGIAFAQDQTAQHDGMPRSAVASGCVDFILPPAQIAAELVRIARHPYSNHEEEPVPSAVGKVPEDEFGKVVRLLTTTFGVDLAHYKHPTLRRRIERRMVLCRSQNAEDYLRYLRENPAELQALFDDVFIQVTSFFRDPETFEALKQVVFPSLHVGPLRRRADPRLGCWLRLG